MDFGQNFAMKHKQKVQCQVWSCPYFINQIRGCAPLEKILDINFQVCPGIKKTRSVERNEFQGQGSFLEPVHARCQRACTLWKNFRFKFWSYLVSIMIGYTRSVENIEFQCQGAVLEPVHARCQRACTLWKFFIFKFWSYLVSIMIG